MRTRGGLSERWVERQRGCAGESFELVTSAVSGSKVTSESNVTQNSSAVTPSFGAQATQCAAVTNTFFAG